MGRKRSSGAEGVWPQRLARFQCSDLTVVEFCRHEGVSAPSFYRWRKRLQQGGGRSERAGQQDRLATDTKKASRFVPVSVSGLNTAEIELPSGVTIRVPVASAEALRTAILAAGDASRGVSPC